jgi:DNA repair exonuclease SbcCD ATPase subunit
VGVAGAASGCFLYNAYNFYDASKQLHQKAKQLNRETAQLDKDVKELLQQYQMLKDIIKKETESIKELEQEEQQIRHLKSCPDQSYYQNYPVSKTLRPSDRWR